MGCTQQDASMADAPPTAKGCTMVAVEGDEDFCELDMLVISDAVWQAGAAEAELKG